MDEQYAMKITSPSEYPVEKWPRFTRPRKPYTFHPVRLVEGDSPIGSEKLSDKDWRLAVKHLRGPIHHHLLKLIPGDYESIAKFAEELGLDELISWGMTLGDDNLEDAWHQLSRDGIYLQERFVTIPKIHLLEAWGFGSQTSAFAEEQERLREAFEYLAAEGADAAIQFFQDYWKPTHPDAGLETWRFPIPELVLVPWPIHPKDDDHPSLGIVEAPAHIFARAWIELYDVLLAGGVPKLCPRCSTPFIGKRKGQKYCDRKCQDQRSRSEHQREYDRMYKRMRRGSITREEFAKWQLRSGRETRQDGE